MLEYPKVPEFKPFKPGIKDAPIVDPHELNGGPTLTALEKLGEIEDKVHGDRNAWAWIPTKPSNPSQLQAHKFVDGEWVPLSIVKFVPWPEAFGSAAERQHEA